MRVHQPLYELGGDMVLDCMECHTPTRMMDTTEVELHLGATRVEELIQDVHYDRASDKMIEVYQTRVRYIPKTKRGLICGSCLSPHHKVFIRRAESPGDVRLRRGPGRWE